MVVDAMMARRYSVSVIRGTRVWLVLATALLLSGATREAAAYRWYFTEEAGAPMRWFRSSLSYRISTREPEEVPWASLEGLTEAAFGAWVDLPGCRIPEVRYAGGTQATARTRPRAFSDPPDNVIVFITSAEQWSAEGYGESWIAITSIAHSRRTGEIVDADIEINDAGFAFSIGATVGEGEVDLPSTLTHELGHFFGLDHSLNPEATMFATYNAGADPLGGRSLDQDDIDGICALYEDAPSYDPIPPDDGCAGGAATDGPLAVLLWGLSWLARWSRGRRVWHRGAALG